MKLYRTTDFQVRRKSRRTRMSVVHLVDFYLPLALTPIFDPTFSESSFCFRPRRSAHEAIHLVQKQTTAATDRELSPSRCDD